MRRHILLLLATALGSGLAAQCQPVPNTGCPSAAPVQCSGSTQVGQPLFLTCVNQGRAQQQLLSVGVCDLGGTLLPHPIVCPTQACVLGVALGQAGTIDTGFQTTALFMPTDVRLIGQTFCAQCFGVVTTVPCITMSQASQFTIQP